MERRKHARNKFEFLVLEHGPKALNPSPTTRILSCIDFSLGGLRLLGKARFDQFQITISSPKDGSPHDATVEVVSRLEDSFGLRFISISKELSSDLSWWPTSTLVQHSDRNLDIAV